MILLVRNPASTSLKRNQPSSVIADTTIDDVLPSQDDIPRALTHVDVLDASAMVHKMKRGVNDLPTEIPALLNVLDDIAKIHPSISGNDPSYPSF